MSKSKYSDSFGVLVSGEFNLTHYFFHRDVFSLTKKERNHAGSILFPPFWAKLVGRTSSSAFQTSFLHSSLGCTHGLKEPSCAFAYTTSNVVNVSFFRKRKTRSLHFLRKGVCLILCGKLTRNRLINFFHHTCFATFAVVVQHNQHHTRLVVVDKDDKCRRAL